MQADSGEAAQEGSGPNRQLISSSLLRRTKGINMTRKITRPYLVAKNETGDFSITVRTTRFNSQGYPLVTSERLGVSFPTATKARSYLRAEYRAEPTDIATS